MRINYPPYLVPGDIVCCPSCRIQLWHVKNFVLQNQRVTVQDLRPFEDKWLIRAHNPMICFECGGELTRAGKFITVDRYQKSSNSTDSRKDGMDKN